MQYKPNIKHLYQASNINKSYFSFISRNGNANKIVEKPRNTKNSSFRYLYKRLPFEHHLIGTESLKIFVFIHIISLLIAFNFKHLAYNKKKCVGFIMSVIFICLSISVDNNKGCYKYNSRKDICILIICTDLLMVCICLFLRHTDILVANQWSDRYWKTLSLPSMILNKMQEKTLKNDAICLL